MGSRMRLSHVVGSCTPVRCPRGIHPGSGVHHCRSYLRCGLLGFSLVFSMLLQYMPAYWDHT